MAGGEGTRLRPLTYNQPKPLVPMANRALMEHAVSLLRRHGFNEIVVTLGFQANAVQNYFGNGAEFGVSMVYATEEVALGTAGSVRNAREQLDERFLVISGDVLTDIDLGEVVRYHQDKQALATMALRSVPNPLEFGIVMTKPDGAVDRFLEKPTWGQVFSDTINTGIYVLEPAVFDHIPPGTADFSTDVFPRLLGDEAVLYGFVTDGYWEDIGTLEAYARAHRDVLDGRVAVEVPGFSLGRGIWLGEGAEVDQRAEVVGPAMIGDYCRVEAGAVLGEYTVLGRNVRVGAGANLERVVVHDNVHLGPGVRLRGCVIGRGSDLRRGARIDEGAVLGDECFVGEHALVHPGVKVFPFKAVEQGATVNSSIVWESRGARHLFGRYGVKGLANVDVSPELAVRLAMAYATTLPRGARVVVSRDTSRVARMLEQSLTAGLNAAGVDVSELEVATVPVTRFGVRQQRGAGGLSVRLSCEDPQSVAIRFFDGDGLDLAEASQRKVERIFYREDFRRCLAAETGDVSYPMSAPDLYAASLIEGLDLERARSAAFKVVLDYAYGATSFVMPAVLGRLGAEVLSLNPYAARPQALSYDRWEHARSVSALVKAAGADFGAVLSPDGEQLALVDGGGRILGDTQGLMAMLALVLGQDSAHRPAAVALAVSAPSATEAMCRAAGTEVVWTKLGGSQVMEVAAGNRVGFAASGSGGYVFPAFLPAYDAVAALVHLFDLLAACGTSLSAVLDGLAEVFVYHEGVVTPWERKGAVMRAMMELGRGETMVLVDGVKIIHPDGWCLVVPDPEEALTHVWAEGPDDVVAGARARDCARKVRELLRA